jgi:hypothetical protein
MIFSTLLMISELSSCKKPVSGPSPSESVASIQDTINGIAFSTTTQVIVPSIQSLQNGTFKVPANMSYFTDFTTSNTINTSTAYFFILNRRILAGAGDTTDYEIVLTSAYPIVAGTYPLYDTAQQHKAIDANPYSTTGSIEFAQTNGTLTLKEELRDSIASGYIIVTQMDMVNKLVSGSFSITDMRTKNSVPGVVTITGQFKNLPLQEL